MTTLAERQAFAPPATTGTPTAIGLALLAHCALALMLTLGVQWKRELPQVTAQAELWATVPVQAAPPAPPIEPPPPEKPTPTPVPTTSAAELKAQADIAIARDKAQREKREREEQQAEEKRAREQALRDKAAKDKLANAAQQKDLAQKEAAERKAQERKKLEAQRQQNLQRMAGLAGATSDSADASPTGTAARSAGPSAAYLESVGARIKQRIVFTDAQKMAVQGNPEVQIDVRIAPGGILLEPQIVKSSGVRAWDDAVVNAILATGTLPRDADGKYPSLIQFSFKPKD